MANNLNGLNSMEYDANGKLSTVTPTGFINTDGYGFKVEYNTFGDPSMLNFPCPIKVIII